MSAPGSLVMEHACNPRNGGAMEPADAIGEASLDGRAPRLKIFLRVADQVVVQAMFQTFGCGYSIACCSVLTELATGKTLGECRAITWQDVSAALGGLPEERVFCAPLAIEALQAAVQNYEAERSTKPT